MKAPLKIANDILQEDAFFEAYQKYKLIKRPKTILPFDLKVVLEKSTKAALINNELFVSELLSTKDLRLGYVDKYFPMLGISADNIHEAAKGNNVLDSLEIDGGNPYGLTLESFRAILIDN